MSWPTVALEDIATVGRGRFSPRPRNDPRYYGGDIPFIQTGDVARSNGRLETFRQTLNEDGLKVSKRFPAKSLAVTIAANIGDVAEVQFDFACPDSLVVVQPHVGIDRVWLRHVIASAKPRLESLATQNAQKNISLDVLRPFPVDLPSQAEQRAIGSLLETWEVATDAHIALMSCLERRKQGLMQQLLTGRRRLKGFKGKWKLLRADKLFSEISVRNQTADEALLSVTQDRGVIPRDMLVGRVTMPAGAVDAFKLVERDNFVISLRSFQGGLEHSAYRGLVSPAYTVLQASEEIHPAFFRHYFKSTDFVKRLSVAVVGIRDGKQISYTDFRSIKLPLPQMDEQKAMTEMLDLADQDIALCRQRLDGLQRQKRALMQKLLSGEWRLPESPAQGKLISKKAL